MIPESWMMAGALFLAVSMGVVSLSLTWEGIRAWRRKAAVQGELARLSERGLGTATLLSGQLLREEREVPEWLEPILLRVPRLQDLDHFITQADSGWGVGTFLLLTAGLGTGAGLATLTATGLALAAVLAAAVGALVPYVILRIKRRRRFSGFEEQFPEAIELLTRAIRAGNAFSTGLRIVAEEAPQPIAAEFRQVFEEQKYGLSLKESLVALSDRIDLVDVKIFVTAVLIQKDSGGNLAEILDNLGKIIRERFKFRRQLRVHTAHGRITGVILAIVPLVTGILLYMMSPDYMMIMFESDAGRTALAVVAGLQILGVLVIRRIVDIDF